MWHKQCATVSNSDNDRFWVLLIGRRREQGEGGELVGTYIDIQLGANRHCLCHCWFNNFQFQYNSSNRQVTSSSCVFAFSSQSRV